MRWKQNPHPSPLPAYRERVDRRRLSAVSRFDILATRLIPYASQRLKRRPGALANAAHRGSAHTRFMQQLDNGREKPNALAMLSAERARNVGWIQAAGLLFGDWGTSRLYVLGLAFLVAGLSSFWLVLMMSLLIVAVGWAYTQICRIYPDGGGVYTAAKHRSQLLGVVGALLLFADYTVTASLSAVDAFHYFGLGKHEIAQVQHEPPGADIRLTHEDEITTSKSRLFHYRSPGLWALVSILV